jgi:hypothetical protein
MRLVDGEPSAIAKKYAEDAVLDADRQRTQYRENGRRFAPLTDGGPDQAHCHGDACEYQYGQSDKCMPKCGKVTGNEHSVFVPRPEEHCCITPQFTGAEKLTVISEPTPNEDSGAIDCYRFHLSLIALS